MIKEVNEACEKWNKTLGVSVKLPDPGKKALSAAMVCNFAVGAGLMAAGIVLSSRWCAVLGGVGMLSGIVLRGESR